MAVPKSKITRMKRGHRRSTDALKNPTYVEDKNSGELRRPHHIDPSIELHAALFERVFDHHFEYVAVALLKKHLASL